ncbi:Ribosomal protein L7Ae/L30e/S12e/Gadd45 [Spatholobus suberectus]|nr:Ribosomal protein L7Ae/L30e/S12e/Gadd45 [Spatholobus suberectus]
MPSRGSAKTPKDGNNSNSSSASLENNCYEGERLTNMLQSIRREIQSARHLDGNSLPEKIWLKQQFSIGVNDVTRVLERMKPCTELEKPTQLFPLRSNHKASSVKLQAVLVASDCNPRWLTKHLLSLASSRSVPLILVRDNKQGSLRLGELVQLKTAIAIGIKVKGSSINKIVQEIIQDNRFKLSPDGQNSARILDVQSDFQDPDKKS